MTTLNFRQLGNIIYEYSGPDSLSAITKNITSKEKDSNKYFLRSTYMFRTT